MIWETSPGEGMAALFTSTQVSTRQAPRTAANRADQLEAFPVLWAAPGSIARTFPGNWTRLAPTRDANSRPRG